MRNSSGSGPSQTHEREKGIAQVLRSLSLEQRTTRRWTRDILAFNTVLVGIRDTARTMLHARMGQASRTDHRIPHMVRHRCMAQRQVPKQLRPRTTALASAVPATIGAHLSHPTEELLSHSVRSISSTASTGGPTSIKGLCPRFRHVHTPTTCQMLEWAKSYSTNGC